MNTVSRRITSLSPALRLATSALALMALAGVCVHGSDRPADPAVQLTGSGHAASTPAYTQPSAAAMNVGASATTTTPPVTVEATTKAVPAKLGN